MQHYYIKSQLTKILKPLRASLLVVWVAGICAFSANEAHAQDVEVKGKVTAISDGQPIPGANILVKGTSKGTTTDVNGNYTISVAEDATLVFSFVGYLKEEVNVSGRSQINVALSEDIATLSEVVVVGYGTQQKKVVTAATVEVDAEDIINTNSLRLEQSLQGQTPGVQITQTSGQPGAGLKVRVRGTGTIGDAEPLYVVDGVPTGDISYLDPSAVERIDVLKDASAAAVYGARASNGVVLITTKKGDFSNKTSVTLDSYYGIQNPYKKLPMLTGEEYARIMNEASVNSGQSPIYTEDEIAAIGEGTDWLDEAFNYDAPVMNHSLHISGGSENSSYSAGLSYYSQEGIVGGDLDKSVYDRITFTVNSEHKAIDDVLTFGENFTYSNIKSDGIADEGIYNNSIRGFLNASPVFPVYDEDGEFARSPIPDEVNPVASLHYNNFSDNTEDKIVGNVYGELDLFKGLSFRTTIGVEASFGTNRSFRPIYELSINNISTQTQATQGSNRFFRYNWNNVLKYATSIERHNLEVLVGTEAQEHSNVWNTASKEGLIFDDFEHAYLNNATNDSTITTNGSRDEYALSSIFGRLQYNFNEKYLLTATVRRDGSTNFGKNNLYGIFPSVSAGWAVSEESFFSTLSPVVNFLKVRGSWGQNGNDRIRSFEYMARINSTNKNYYFGSGETKYVGSAPNQLANPDLKWETSEQIDVGFEATLFDNLDLTFDWYKKTTKDWLVEAPIPDIIGTGAPFINGGTIENIGYEIDAGYHRNFGELGFSIGANVAFNENKVTEIQNSEGIIHGQPNLIFQGIPEIYRAQEGFPVGYFYGYEVAGIFQSEEEIASYAQEGDPIQPSAEPGDVKFVDRNGNGTIDSEDRTQIGDPNPDMTYGLNIKLDYKGIDFSVYAYGMGGHQNVLGNRVNERFYNNYTTDILDRWTGEGTSNSTPRVTRGGSGNYTRFSELYIHDATFLRIKSLNIGYDFKSLFEGLPVNQARLYFSANNLFTFTKYTGMDPEVGFGGTDADGNTVGWVTGVDVGYYPSPRTYSIGLNIKL